MTFSGDQGDVVALPDGLRGGALGEKASPVLSFTPRCDRTKAQGHTCYFNKNNNNNKDGTLLESETINMIPIKSGLIKMSMA